MFKLKQHFTDITDTFRVIRAFVILLVSRYGFGMLKYEITYFIIIIINSCAHIRLHSFMNILYIFVEMSSAFIFLFWGCFNEILMFRPQSTKK